MNPGVLAGLVAVLGIVSVYFWIVRRRETASAHTSSANSGPEK